MSLCNYENMIPATVGLSKQKKVKKTQERKSYKQYYHSKKGPGQRESVNSSQNEKCAKKCQSPSNQTVLH